MNAVVAASVLILFWLGASVLIPTSSHQGPKTDHFDGVRFFNQSRSVHAETSDLVRWLSNRKRGQWNKIKAEPGPPPPASVTDGGLRITFVGHATLLVQVDGINVLTDPIWSTRCSPVPLFGPKRVRPPGIRFEDLPPIDAVIISHNHYDHLDVRTLRMLDAAHKPLFFVGLGNRELLAQVGIEHIAELDWWESRKLPTGGEIHFVPAEHFSRRGADDENKTLWGGFVIRATSGDVYFAGDTGFGRHFQQVRDRFGAPRVALLPIGAYQPRWFMKNAHINPTEAVEAHQILGAHRSIAMHFGTFPLADDGQNEPVVDLRNALEGAGVSVEDFLILGFGEGRDISASNRAKDVDVVVDGG